jgi:hypothetical protein
MKQLIIIVSVICALSACNGGSTKKGKHIAMGDNSLIVTEQDSAFLGNVVRDLAEVHGTLQSNSIDAVMSDVDSTQKSIDLNKKSATKNISGLQIDGDGFTITLGGAVVRSGNRLIFQTGQVEENMTCQTNNLQECKIEQRSTSVLQLVINGKSTPLTSLGNNTTEWQELPGKDCTFITHSKVDMKYREIDAKKLYPLAKPILTSSKLSKAEQAKIDKQLRESSSTNSDLYQAVASTTELRISGKVNGKSVTKTVTINAK